MLVGDRFDGPSGKQLHTVLAVGDDVVARGNGRIQVLAPLVDPVKGVVHGTEFSGIARGSPTIKPIRVRGGRGHWAPYGRWRYTFFRTWTLRNPNQPIKGKGQSSKFR